MIGYYEPAVRGIVSRFIAEDTILGTILIGEYGLATMTVTYVLGLLLPLVVGFYFALSIMEDSGYLPRLATLVDRLMNTIGLNGRAIIPMILGFGCVTMATITTRILGSARERTIATAVLGLAIPCSAQLGVISGMLAALGPKYVAVYGIVMLVILGLVGKILHSVLPGESTDLFIDLPPVRWPRMENVLKKTITKSYAFLEEATPLFMLGALIISILELTGALTAIQGAVAPLTVGILQLPKETATAFIMGIIRRDFGAAGLREINLTPDQLLVSLVTITLFVPCVASMIVMLKERGKKEGVLIWVGSWVTAFLIGGFLSRLLVFL
jgi:ferrous iron transport protein B